MSGEDAGSVPAPPPGELAASPNPAEVAAAAAAVPTDANDAGDHNDSVSSTVEEQVPVEAAQSLLGDAAPASPQEEAVTASPKINDTTASLALQSGTATAPDQLQNASFEGTTEGVGPMAMDSAQQGANGTPQKQPAAEAPIPTNGQDERTAEEQAMQLEQQNDEGGKNADDNADDAVVDLLDSDDDEDVPTSATGQQPQVSGVPLPATPPAAPGGGVAVPPPAADGGGGGDDYYSDDSDIEIVGTSAAPAPPPQPQQQPQQQYRAGSVVASGAPGAGGAVAARADAIPLWMKNAAAEALAAGLQLESEEFGSFLQIRRQQNEEKERMDKLKKRLSTLQYELHGSCAMVQKLADDGKCGRGDFNHVDNFPGYIPTWEFPIPGQRQAPQRQQYVPNAVKASAFKLSLLSCADFTITPIQRPDEWNRPRGSLAGLRIHIKKAARPHGGAKFERADDDGDDNDDNGDSTEGVAPVGPAGRWRIPLGAYESLVGYLATLADEHGRPAYIEGIPQRNLQMATLGRELKNKAYPSAQALIDEGIPSGIAKALAPYQRGGVDFALHQDGRVLIADEMGLGKTIQAIAAMSAYATEWPLIVFSPSSARYHWQVEFQHWLGEDSVISKQAADDEGGVDGESADNGIAAAINLTSETDGDAKMSSFDEKKDDDDELSANPETLSSESPAQRKRAKSPVQPMQLLRKSQVNVLTSSKDPLFPTADTRVVICSYGLAPNLIESGKIKKGIFKCAIVDESHMLKNKNTKRARTIVPILMNTTRCIMLSGTPALSRPMELWPQLSVLGHERGWWSDESDFVRKYVNREGETEGGGSALAELHTLLTSTVMIRRMKADMLKNLPLKERHNARIRVTDETLKDEFDRSMAILREGKGALGNLAREHKKEEDERKEAAAAEDANKDGDSASQASGANSNARAVGENPNVLLQTIDIEEVRADAENIRLSNVRNIQQHLLAQFQSDPNLSSQPQLFPQFFHQRHDHEVARFNQEHEQLLSTVKVGSIYNNCRIVDKAAEEEARKSILHHLYSLTGKAKVGHVVKMLNAWLDDPTKGKLCIFAHHIEILDEITKGAGLSNAAGSLRKYIRIDGKTNPKARQEQMMVFQSDPTVRIAILGITAAGVAITLTAASTVWFAELFWTPAIMIQAEDRCHRIGQQATVKCLYIIAKGTLDEVLWKLVEKKFRQLGEFVEGKENLDIVVHRTFDCGLQAIATDEDEEEDEDDDDDEEDEFDTEGPKKKRIKRQRTRSFGDLADEDSIQHDIEELAKEEEAMLNLGLDDDDENNGDASGETNNNSTKSFDGSREGSKNAALEKKKAAVICLDDSDDEAEACKKKNGTGSNGDNDEASTNAHAENSSAPSTAAPASRSVPTIADSITAIIKSGDIKNGVIDRRARFSNLELYSVRYFGPSFGLSMVSFAGRVVVKSSANVPNIPPEQNEKPNPGDFIVRVEQTNAPMNCALSGVLNFMKNAVANARGNGIRLMFGHDSEFNRFFQETFIPAQRQEKEEEFKRVEEELAAFAASAPAAATETETTGVVSAPLPAPPAPAPVPIPAPVPNVQPEQDDDVIELLDD